MRWHDGLLLDFCAADSFEFKTNRISAETHVVKKRMAAMQGDQPSPFHKEETFVMLIFGMWRQGDLVCEFSKCAKVMRACEWQMWQGKFSDWYKCTSDEVVGVWAYLKKLLNCEKSWSYYTATKTVKTCTVAKAVETHSTAPKTV